MVHSSSMPAAAGHYPLPHAYKTMYTVKSPSKRCTIAIDISDILHMQVQYAAKRLQGTLDDITDLEALVSEVRLHKYVLEALQAHLEAKNKLVQADVMWDGRQPIARYQMQADSALAHLIFQIGRVIHATLPTYMIKVHRPYPSYIRIVDLS